MHGDEVATKQGDQVCTAVPPLLAIWPRGGGADRLQPTPRRPGVRGAWELGRSCVHPAPCSNSAHHPSPCLRCVCVRQQRARQRVAAGAAAAAVAQRLQPCSLGAAPYTGQQAGRRAARALLMARGLAKATCVAGGTR